MPLRISGICDSLNALLCPLQVFLHLLCRFYAIRKLRTAGLESALGKCLQFHEFAILSIEFARTIRTSAYPQVQICKPSNG